MANGLDFFCQLHDLCCNCSLIPALFQVALTTAFLKIPLLCCYARAGLVCALGTKLKGALYLHLHAHLRIYASGVVL